MVNKTFLTYEDFAFNFTIDEREVTTDTIETADDVKRIIYRICTNNLSPEREELEYVCNKIIEKEDQYIKDTPTETQYGAIAFFFWDEGEDVGFVASDAAYDYAPNGLWNCADLILDPLCPAFLLEEQYYRY